MTLDYKYVLLYLHVRIFMGVQGTVILRVQTLMAGEGQGAESKTS